MISKNIFAGLALSLTVGTANASFLDFQNMADTVPGEGPITSVSGTGFTATIAGYTAAGLSDAYLDAGKAGLGPCLANSADKCSGDNSNTVDNFNAADDLISFVFDVDVFISGIWLNNNHDHDYSLAGDTVNVNGDDVMITAAMQDGPAYGSPAVKKDYLLDTVFSVKAGDEFTISYVDEQFYIGAMRVSTPEPAIPALLALGLIAVGLSTRRNKKA